MPTLQAARQAVGFWQEELAVVVVVVREVAGGEVTYGPRSKATAAVVDGFGECWGERDGCTIRYAALLCDAMRSVMQQQMTKASSSTRESLCGVVSCVCVEQKSKKGWDLVVVEVVDVVAGEDE